MKHQHDTERRVHQVRGRPLSGNEGGMAATKLYQGRGDYSRCVPVLGATAAVIIAFMGLFSYIPGLGLLGSVHEGYIPMAPSTAVSFIVLGGILLYITLLSVSGVSFFLLGALAALVSIFGLLEVAGHYTGTDLNFEDALVPSAGYLGDIPIARMSHATGAAFFFAGLAVLSLVLRLSRTHAPDPRLGHCAGSLGSLLVSISLIFCLAYLFGSPLLYGQGATVPMALTTALAFLMLAGSTVGVAGVESFPVRLLALAEDVGQAMSARKRILVLFLIMVGACALVIAVMTVILYRHDLQEHREMLQFTAKNQARLMEAVARYDEIHAPGRPTQATLSQIIEAHEHYQGFGETGEFALAHRDGNSIVFIQRHVHGAHRFPPTVAFDSELAEPMRRALQGLSGTIVGTDYRGQTVLAAYEPVAVLNAGVVIKINLTEIRNPFIRSAVAAAAVAVLVILAGTVLFFRISNPIVVRLESYSRDLEKEIEERRRAEEELLRSEYIVYSSSDMMALIDKNFIYLAVNPAYLNAFGKVKEELVGHTASDVFGEEFFETIMKPNAERCFSGESVNYQEWFKFSAQGCRYMDISYSQYVKNRQIEGFVVNCRDITERRRLEDQKVRLTEELHQAQKMEAIGQLASGVTHDVNNLLQVISAHAELTSLMVKPNSQIAESMESVAAAVDQAVGVTRSLLTFSHKTSAKKGPTDLCATVEKTMHMLQGTLPAMIELVVDIDCEPAPWINADPTQVQQIILNLAINARDAMPDGGTLHISVSPAELTESKRVADGCAAPLTKLELTDTGTGMPAEIQQRIFEPFFTTKKNGQGTGLGLSIIHGIVEDHGAFLEVDSSEGAGSTFTIYFPCISAELPLVRDLDKVMPPVGKSELILVADDNQQNCDIIAGTLASFGYEVLKAADGNEILEIFHQHEQEIRLFILDVGLPKQSGLRSLQIIRESGFDTPAIIITGSADVLQDQLDQFSILLSKPFTMQTLGRYVGDQMKQLEDSVR